MIFVWNNILERNYPFTEWIIDISTFLLKTLTRCQQKNRSKCNNVFPYKDSCLGDFVAAARIKIKKINFFLKFYSKASDKKNEVKKYADNSLSSQ